MKKEWKYVSSAILGMVLIMAIYHFAFNQQEKTVVKETIVEQEPSTIPTHQASLLPGMIPAMNGGALDFTYASEASLNSVVHVTTTVVQTQKYTDPMMELFFGPNAGTQERKFKGSGSGSGVIVSDDGYIVTNNHVIQNAQEINIILNDNTEYPAKVIGTDPSTDLALIKVNAQNLPPIKMGNSSEVKVGEWVLAVGNPFNLNSTVTAGIVSAKARNINIIRPNSQGEVFPIESFIQTDAAVNPGNSGGALVNTQGELIGINTAIASGTGYYTGYSFAIPINLVQKVIADLKEFGSVKRAILGVQISDINQELKEKENLTTSTGVYVAKTVEGGAAERAGILAGDVITRINDKEVKSSPELQMEIGQKNPNETVIVTLIRNGNEKILPVKLKGIHEESFFTSAKSSHNSMGAQFQDAPESELKELGIQHGVKITKVHPGKILAAGIPKDFIITKVDNRAVKSAKELKEYLERKKGGVLIEGYYPSGEKGYFGFGV